MDKKSKCELHSDIYEEKSKRKQEKYKVKERCEERKHGGMKAIEKWINEKYIQVG